jgi:hypothetical protein
MCPEIDFDDSSYLAMNAFITFSPCYEVKVDRFDLNLQLPPSQGDLLAQSQNA